MLEHAFTSGHIADLMLVMLALEAAIVVALARRPGHFSSGGKLLASLAAGACLVFALRGALTDAAWQSVAACLILALVAHVVELSLWFGSSGS